MVVNKIFARWTRLFVAAAAIAEVTSAVEVLPVAVHRPISSSGFTSALSPLKKRAEDNGGPWLELPLTNAITKEAWVNNGYYLTMDIGTPPQSIHMFIDTRGSYNWVLPTGLDFCSLSPTVDDWAVLCASTFTTNQSSTFANVTDGAYIYQPSGSNESIFLGYGFTDDVSVGGVTLSDFYMGISVETTPNTLGLGFPANDEDQDAHPTFLERLVSDGVIAKRVFSLYLVGDYFLFFL
ncbi:aspartic peptidase domain-containing protein [Xylariales sp. PMI_506]|nr:aspartic peptidase domain-containing protein [Xylariales sp. PMI_506]